MPDESLTEAMRVVLHRLGELGWVQQSLVSDQQLQLRLTPQGRAKLLQLHHLMDEIGWPASLEQTMALYQACSVAAADEPPNPSGV